MKNLIINNGEEFISKVNYPFGMVPSEDESPDIIAGERCKIENIENDKIKILNLSLNNWVVVNEAEFKTIKTGLRAYYMVWVDENEKWHYFKDSFDKSQFDLTIGYVLYSLIVNENGVIVKDDYKNSNIGKKFNKCYDASLWN